MLDLNQFNDIIVLNSELVCKRSSRAQWIKYYRYHNYKITVHQNKIDQEVTSLTIVKMSEKENRQNG